MKHQAGRNPTGGDAARMFLTTAVAAPFFLAACTSTSIWNAGDPAVWVRDRAVDQGCQRETIKLDDWYPAEAEANVWQGICQDPKGNEKAFGVNVDPVWKPPKPAC